LLPRSSILHAFCDEEEPPPSVMNYTRTEQPLSDCNPLSLWLQRLRAATNSSGQEPSLQFDSEQAIILYGEGGGRSRQPIAAATTSSFLWSSICEIILCRDYCHPPENRSTILAHVLWGYYYYKAQRLDLKKAHSRGTTHICAILILSSSSSER
jgi:hypothetical protein